MCQYIVNGFEEDILEVEREVCGQDGQLQQLHEVAVLRGWEVGEDVVTLWRQTQKNMINNVNFVLIIVHI